MDAWPVDTRPPKPVGKSKRKGKAKTKDETPTRNYPVVDNGVLCAATLVDKDGKLEWVSLFNPETSVDGHRHRLRLVKTLDVYPATKAPPPPEPKSTIKQRADQAAHLLRTRFPEVDVTAELIREQVTEDFLYDKELAAFDSFEGNVLDIVNAGPAGTYLAFPMGELSTELNLSPILCQRDVNAIYKPGTVPIRTFNTPIQQIIASTNSNALFGVRTFGATSLLKLEESSESSCELSDITFFTSRDVGEASIMDVKISKSPFEVLFTNKYGGVYGCSLNNGRKTMIQLHVPQAEAPARNPFFRLASCSSSTECLIASEKIVDRLDFRTNDVTTLYKDTSRDIFTSIEDLAEDNIIRLCSTAQIIWLDPRYPARPLLGYEHRRQYDRTLWTRTMFMDGSPLTFLSSRRNKLLTIYDVSRHEDDLLIRVNDSPYCISSMNTTDTSRRLFSGRAFLPLSADAMAVFQIDDCANVQALELQRSISGAELFAVEESHAVKELRDKAKNLKSDLERYGDQDSSKADLFPAYDYLFRLHMEQQRQVEEEQAEAFYDTLDQLPTFWQTHDVPLEHMLTLHDVVRLAHEDPGRSFRSDFAAGSLLNSSRGIRALLQDKLPVTQLRRGVPWHLNIADIHKRLDPDLDLSSNVESMMEALRRYDLKEDPERSGLAVRREAVAREQLSVDLLLSKDVYSVNAFAKPPEVGNDLETMTEALSLGGHGKEEPPEVDFGYLRPTVKERKEHYTDDRGTLVDESIAKDIQEKVSLPMGVKLLLNDWEVGSKIEDYVYKDPYDSSDDRKQPSHIAYPSQQLRATQTMPTLSQTGNLHSQRPPTILPANLLGTTKAGTITPFPSSSQRTGGFGTPAGRRPMVVRSQDAVQQSTLYGSQTTMYSQPDDSQRFMASTQILPGPHGGRPAIPKKPAKKRLGGF